MWPFSKKSLPSTNSIEFYLINKEVRCKMNISSVEDILYMPSLVSTIFTKDTELQCNSLIKDLAKMYGKDVSDLICSELIPPGRKISWESGEEYKQEELSEEEIEEIREELGLDEDEEIHVSRPKNVDECWVGHTNFDVALVAKDIKNIDGVDAFTQMSRHRFVVGVGKLFTFTDIRKIIESKCIR